MASSRVLGIHLKANGTVSRHSDAIAVSHDNGPNLHFVHDTNPHILQSILLTLFW
jgi:hypothetical protein